MNKPLFGQNLIADNEFLSFETQPSFAVTKLNSSSTVLIVPDFACELKYNLKYSHCSIQWNIIIIVFTCCVTSAPLNLSSITCIWCMQPSSSIVRTSLLSCSSWTPSWHFFLSTLVNFCQNTCHACGTLCLKICWHYFLGFISLSPLVSCRIFCFYLLLRFLFAIISLLLLLLHIPSVLCSSSAIFVVSSACLVDAIWPLVVFSWGLQRVMQAHAIVEVGCMYSIDRFRWWQCYAKDCDGSSNQ